MDEGGFPAAMMGGGEEGEVNAAALSGKEVAGQRRVAEAGVWGACLVAWEAWEAWEVIRWRK